MISPKSLIGNSLYDSPSRHWQQALDGALTSVEECHLAEYEIVDIRNRQIWAMMDGIGY